MAVLAGVDEQKSYSEITWYSQYNQPTEGTEKCIEKKMEIENIILPRDLYRY